MPKTPALTRNPIVLDNVVLASNFWSSGVGAWMGEFKQKSKEIKMRRRSISYAFTA
jgi:hypothetical protein